VELSLQQTLKDEFGIDFPTSGGWGGSREQPVIVHRRTPNNYVAVEHQLLRCICQGRGVRAKFLQSSLFEHEGRMLERMKIETQRDTETQTITQVENYYFDLTECLDFRVKNE
jgi:hypothetical protein